MNLRRGTVVALLVVAAGALVAHSLVFDFVTDDAYISFVYARNLAQHGQLVFNLGEPPVEGYTNFLWTLLLAGLLKLGLLPELASRIVGTAFAVATLGVTAWLSRRLRVADAEDGEWSAWDALPALLLAGVPGFACWASGGLETQMFTFFVALGSAWHLGELLDDAAPRKRTAIAFGLAALTRPEGILFFALAWLYRVLIRLRRRQLVPTRADVTSIACFLALVVPHFVWRRWYYGWWLPNTFYIKSSGVGGHWQQGGYYLFRVVETFHLWVVPLVVVAGWLARRERGSRLAVGYVTLVVALFAVYVASVAGDFMGLFRFVMPAIPLLALVAADGLRLTLTTVSRRQPLLAPAVVALLYGLHAWHAVGVDRAALVIDGPSDRGIDRPGWLRWYTNDRAAIGRWFARYARPDDYAAVGGAGAQVYFSTIRSLDCYGLSDAHIAHDVPANSSRPGHQKYAPVGYILSKHPTIITSNNYQIRSTPYVGPDAAFWQRQGYHYVTADVPGLSSPKYSFLLRNDRALGPLPALPSPATPPHEERDP
jgi:arabinofuranosyltransferase